MESASSPISELVSFDGTGAPPGLKPNTVHNLSVRPGAGGTFEIGFDYDPRGHEAPPALFAIFADGGDGVVDYGSAIGSVEYKPRAGRFRFTTDAFAHGTAQTFSVRAVAADGTDDGSTAAVSAIANAEPPPIQSDVFVELVDAD